jgi:hypothetical protein
MASILAFCVLSSASPQEDKETEGSQRADCPTNDDTCIDNSN